MCPCTTARINHMSPLSALYGGCILPLPMRVEGDKHAGSVAGKIMGISSKQCHLVPDIVADILQGQHFCDVPVYTAGSCCSTLSRAVVGTPILPPQCRPSPTDSVWLQMVTLHLRKACFAGSVLCSSARVAWPLHESQATPISTPISSKPRSW